MPSSYLIGGTSKIIIDQSDLLSRPPFQSASEKVKTQPPPTKTARRFAAGQKEIDSKQQNLEQMTTQSELTLPFILAEWEDESLANRAHVFIHMPSGTEEESVIKDPKVEENFLQFSIRWPQAITSLDTMFVHS